MQTWLHFLLLTSFFFIIVLSLLIPWPWIHAAYVWRDSTIKTLDISLTNKNNAIPKIIHQTYRDQSTIPSHWQRASNSCQTIHSNYEYKFWSDQDGRRLIEEKFPSLLSTYDSYPYNIQRADVIRLVVLYIYGGVYLDMDIFCLKPLDNLLKYDLILPFTTPVGLSNDIIFSRAKHPFLLHVLNNLPKSNRNLLTK